MYEFKIKTTTFFALIDREARGENFNKEFTILWFKVSCVLVPSFWFTWLKIDNATFM